ncbi:beta-glucosidase [Kribbella sp. VKM Ac-2571]|uniref:glycoside hydrolase family 3 protein n=1 Tax=Kribbella sp. VKM Ac-2571 TaxID=2512222 RepID=UPI00105DB594|nr:glycoside hydrolase family 3 protein [Kribbella sp. VKM Ac-2571]TDO66468.1 beta-glucosidase [Kribbella sp. VKM Ac-2571]
MTYRHRVWGALVALLLVPAFLVGQPARAEPLPEFRNPDLPLKVRLDDLTGRLTLDEKISLLHQYQPAIPRLGIASFKTGTEALHGVAWLGKATVFPQAVGLGSTWDPNLIKRVGSAVGDEARAFNKLDPAKNGLNLWAPVVNQLRDPRWGRNEEGYAEDPLLTSEIATAYGRGLEGDDPRYLKTAPTLKHFASYNVETDRARVSASVRPRVLHEYEYKAFQPALTAGAATGVMASYNLLNGRPTHVSPELGETVRSWSADDLMIVGDASGAGNVSGLQQYYPTAAEGAAAAIKAGLDSFTENDINGGPTVAAVKEALAKGLLTEADIDKPVEHLLSIRFRLGEFDPAGRNPYEKIGPDSIDSPAHRELAREAARKQLVLLENKHQTLPLDAAKTKDVAVIGPLADTVYEDWYSGTMPYRITPRAGIAERLGAGSTVTATEGVDRIALRSIATGKYVTAPAGAGGGALTADAATAGAAQSLDVFDWGGGTLALRSAANGKYVSRSGNGLVNDQDKPNGWFVQQQFGLEKLANGNYVLRYRGNEVKEPWNGPNQYIVLQADGKLAIGAATQDTAAQFAREILVSGTAAAVEAAKKADTAVVVVGSTPFINGREDDDRQDTALAAGQQAIVKAVTAANPRTVVVLESSYPLTGDWSQAQGVLWTSHAGQETGHALADVLFGDYSPSGRLPQTWYRTDKELPDPLDFDVIKAGWTYQYHRATPLYPFGHGLTYGTFRYSGLRVDSPVVAANGRLKVSVDVTNTSRTASEEVVQLYTAQRTSRVAQPVKTLRGFERLAFAPGQRRTVSFDVKASDLAFWDVTRNKWVVESAVQDVQVGSSSADIRARTTVAVRGEVIPPRDLSRRTAAADFDDYSGIELIDAAKVRGDAVGKTSAGDWISFQDVQLGSGATRLEAAVSRASEGTGKVEIRLGSPAGPLAGTLTVPVTGDRYTWVATTAQLNPRLTRGVRDVYLVFTGAGTNIRDLAIR